MQLLRVVVVLAAVTAVFGHSWMACSDYRGPVDYYDETKCLGYPRAWEARRGAGALTVDPKGYHIGIDTGYNYQPAAGGAMCQQAIAQPITNGYTTKYPNAVYEAGKSYCLAWPTKNHVAGCQNVFIPDAEMSIYYNPTANPTADPASTVFTNNPVVDFFGTHTFGQADCLGYQRAPKFCENPDKAMATGCFTAPNVAPGMYTFVWYWKFNNLQDPPYTTCWDAQIVAAGSPQSRGVGGLTGTTTVTDALDPAGSTTTCRTKWAAVPGFSTLNAPTAGSTSTNNQAPPNPAANTAAPALTGNSLRIDRAPVQITATDRFTATVSFSTTARSQLVVDLLETVAGSATPVWHGNGNIAVSGVGSIDVPVTIAVPASTGGSFFIRAWLVDKTVYDTWAAAVAAGTTAPEPWNAELAGINSPVVVGSSVIYATNPTAGGGGVQGSSGASAISVSSVVLASLSAVAVAVARLF